MIKFNSCVLRFYIRYAIQTEVLTHAIHVNSTCDKYMITVHALHEHFLSVFQLQTTKSAREQPDAAVVSRSMERLHLVKVCCRIMSPKLVS